MQLFLDDEKFLQKFSDAKDYGRGDSFNWKERLCKGRGLETPEDQRAFDTFYKVMQASSPDELGGITIEDVLDCWCRRDDFEYAFQENSREKYLGPAGENILRMRTRRKRRVL